MNNQLFNLPEQSITPQLQLTVLQSNIEVLLSEQVVLNIIEANRKFPENEWSGICFYNIENPQDDITNYKLNVVGFVPLHVGSKTSTEFKFDNKHINYMLENGFEDCHFGHIHSHNTMQVFFSEVDNSDLRNSSPDYFMLLSLIVNNKLEFKARVAQKVSVEETIITKTLSGSKSQKGTQKDKVIAYETVVFTNLKEDKNFLLALGGLTLPVYQSPVLTSYGGAPYNQELPFPSSSPQSFQHKQLKVTNGKVDIKEFIQQNIFEDYSFKTLDEVIKDWEYEEIDWDYVWEDYCDVTNANDTTRASDKKYLEFINLVDNKIRNTNYSNTPYIATLLKKLKKEIDEHSTF